MADGLCLSLRDDDDSGAPFGRALERREELREGRGLHGRGERERLERIERERLERERHGRPLGLLPGPVGPSMPMPMPRHRDGRHGRPMLGALGALARPGRRFVRRGFRDTSGPSSGAPIENTVFADQDGKLWAGSVGSDGAFTSMELILPQTAQYKSYWAGKTQPNHLYRMDVKTFANLGDLGEYEPEDGGGSCAPPAPPPAPRKAARHPAPAAPAAPMPAPGQPLGLQPQGPSCQVPPAAPLASCLTPDPSDLSGGGAAPPPVSTLIGAPTPASDDAPDAGEAGAILVGAIVGRVAGVLTQFYADPAMLFPRGFLPHGMRVGLVREGRRSLLVRFAGGEGWVPRGAIAWMV